MNSYKKNVSWFIFKNTKERKKGRLKCKLYLKLKANSSNNDSSPSAPPPPLAGSLLGNTEICIQHFMFGVQIIVSLVTKNGWLQIICCMLTRLNKK